MVFSNYFLLVIKVNKCFIKRGGWKREKIMRNFYMGEIFSNKAECDFNPAKGKLTGRYGTYQKKQVKSLKYATYMRRNTKISKINKCLNTQKGIFNYERVIISGGEKVIPAILIFGHPNSAGKENTPWKDVFDSDRGHIRYFGDNKTPGKSPDTSEKNKVLLEAYGMYESHDVKIRKQAPPILFFEQLEIGIYKFHGFGIIDKVELVTQKNKLQQMFTNYAFDFTVFHTKNENELFNWEWINERRTGGIPIDITLKKAPTSWKNWVRYGKEKLNSCRRNLAELEVTKGIGQTNLPKQQEKLLNDIYNYYNGKKHDFEYLAAYITELVLKESNHNYFTGWLTKKSSDGGKDFIGRLDIGSGFSRLKVITIGQAKCEKINKPTNGKDIARLVARLKRGWIGVYVTTGFFSKNVQIESLEDGYPIIFINGKRISEEIEKEMVKIGLETSNTMEVHNYLSKLKNNYEIKNRRPEEILY